MELQNGATQLLGRLEGDRAGSFPRLIEAVYADLRRIAGRRMHDRFGPELAGLTLQPTALANEVVMEMMKQRQRFENSGQFFALAARITMRLLTDYQRRRLADKRGGGQRGVELGSDVAGARAARPSADDGEATFRALSELHELDARKAEVVTLHVLCGMPLPQVAEMVGASLPTVERDWRFAKTWLAQRLEGDA